MAQIYGTNRVRQLEQQLEHEFATVRSAPDLDPELQALCARYLAIRIAGFAEESLKALVSAHALHFGSPRLQRYVSKHVSKLWGINREKLGSVINDLDSAWWTTLEQDSADDVEVLNSVGKLRDAISHGGQQSVSLHVVEDYRTQVLSLVRDLCELLDPQPGTQRQPKA